MGKTMDALLGRNFKTSKFKTLLKLAISRASILSNQHQTRLSQARSDVKELLLLGQQDRAMLRVEHVVKEQNMVDVFSVIDFYCHLLLERVKLLAQNNECHEELREAATSLIYAASRCGEFPELQKIRDILTSKFGKEFGARAVELRNNCGVSPKLVQKFSIRRPSFESRAKFLKDIASECCLTLQLEEDAPLSHDKTLQEEKLEVAKIEDENKTEKAVDTEGKSLTHRFSLFKDIKELEEFSKSMKLRTKYTGVAAAAQEAFESAAHAAAAARAAVELSMSKSMKKGDHQDDDDSDSQEGIVIDFDVSPKTKALMIHNCAASEETECCSENSSSFEFVRRVEEASLEADSKIEIKDEKERDFAEEKTTSSSVDTEKHK